MGRKTQIRSSPRKRGPRATDRVPWIPACAGVNGIGRRSFMLTLAAAIAWPRVARAQQAEQTRRVGVLMPFDAQDSFGREIVAALREGLNERGWAEGRNVRIDARWIGGDDERRSAYAAELVRSAPDVLFACFAGQLAALWRETRAIPIVFVGVSDPVAAGYVESFARPGGNITGFVFFEPRQNSTGGKTRLGGITKRGNRYLRRLLINGASANLLRSKA